MGYFFNFSMPHTLNCMCVGLFKFHFWISKQFLCCPKRPALPRHIKVWVSFELFGALCMLSLVWWWTSVWLCQDICQILMRRLHNKDWAGKKVTILYSKYLIVKNSGIIKFLYLHLTWLCGSWIDQRLLKI